MPANLVYVGTYTQPSPPRRGEGIYVFLRYPTAGSLARSSTRLSWRSTRRSASSLR